MEKEKRKKLEETCDSNVCAYKGKGVCSFVEGQYCPMYTPKEETGHGED